MIRKNETIPFDVATARTVRYDFDVDSAQDAIDEIRRQDRITGIRSHRSRNPSIDVSWICNISALSRTNSPAGCIRVLPLWRTSTAPSTGTAMRSRVCESLEFKRQFRRETIGASISTVWCSISKLRTALSLPSVVCVHSVPMDARNGCCCVYKSPAREMSTQERRCSMHWFGWRNTDTDRHLLSSTSTLPELRAMFERLIGAHDLYQSTTVDDLPF